MAAKSTSRGPARRPTTVLLVRHGRTPTTGKVLPGRAKGLHLSDEGRRQAETAAERIVSLGSVDALYCSPLERTRETAAPIAAIDDLLLSGLLLGRLDTALLEFGLGNHDATLPACGIVRGAARARWGPSLHLANTRLNRGELIVHHPPTNPGGSSDS